MNIKTRKCWGDGRVRTYIDGGFMFSAYYHADVKLGAWNVYFSEIGGESEFIAEGSGKTLRGAVDAMRLNRRR